MRTWGKAQALDVLQSNTKKEMYEEYIEEEFQWLSMLYSNPGGIEV